MNTPVSYELAKLLKEKGFDIPVRNYYLQKEKGEYLHEGFEDDYWGDNRIVNWNKDVVGIKPFQGFVSAPSISDVVMWLYEKHIIWIQVKPGGRLETWDFIVQKKNNNFAVPFFEIKQHKPYFNSPTEAYEAAIEYTLNNLI